MHPADGRAMYRGTRCSVQRMGRLSTERRPNILFIAPGGRESLAQEARKRQFEKIFFKYFILYFYFLPFFWYTKIVQKVQRYGVQWIGGQNRSTEVQKVQRGTEGTEKY